MNATRQTNTFSGGLSMDVDYSVLKDNQYIYAENIRILTNEGSSFAAMQNICLLYTSPSPRDRG